MSEIVAWLEQGQEVTAFIGLYVGLGLHTAKQLTKDVKFL
jgi:hypothetical protein